MASKFAKRIVDPTKIDSRIWPMVMMIGFFAYIVMKEVQWPSSVMAVFAGMGVLGLFMTSLQHPELSLYVLVVYIPFSRLLVGDFGTEATAFNLTNALMLLVFISHAANANSKRIPLFASSPFNWLVWLFCAMGTASLLRASFQYGSWYLSEYIIPLKRWLTPMLLYFLTLWMVREKRTWKSVVVLMMVTVAIVGAMATWDYIQAGEATSLEKSRIGSIAQNPNTLAAFFNYYMFLFLGFFLTYAGSGRAWLLLLPFLLCFRGIMVTFSRGGYLGFAAGNLGTAFFKNFFLFLLGVGALACVIANPSLLPKGIQYRMGMTVQHNVSDVGDMTESLEASAATRVQIWRGAIQMIQDNPWWGVGYGAFPNRIGAYTSGLQEDRDAHNTYLLLAAEMGIPTLVVFLIAVLVGGWYTFWLYRHTQDKFFKATSIGWLGGLWALLVVNCFGSRIDSQEVTGYLWVLFALIMRGVLMEREARRKGKLVKKKVIGYRKAAPVPAAS